MSWWVYLVRCSDDTLYCGVCTDVARRVREHCGELPGGARYTRSRRPVALAACREFPDRSAACRVEAFIKKLPRARKLFALTTWENDMSDDAKAAMHTAEHVLNQTMVRLLGCERCFSAHLNRKKSKCDYRFERPLTDAEANEIQKRVNEVLAMGLPVHEETMDREKAGREFDLSRLPDDAGETVRVVRIGDYDACPCIGDHVADTARVGRFRLTTHDHADGVLRLRFKLEQ